MYKKDISQEAKIKNLNVGQLLVISTINFLIENKPQAFPSQRYIALLIGYSRRQVVRIIRELCKRGLLFKSTKFNRDMGINETCVYYLAGWLQTKGIKSAIQRTINALTFCGIRKWISRPAANVSPYILKEHTRINLSALLGAVALQKAENYRRRFALRWYPPPENVVLKTTLQNGNDATGRAFYARYECNVKKKEYEDVQVSTIGRWSEPDGYPEFDGVQGEDSGVCGDGTPIEEQYPSTIWLFDGDMQAA